MALFLASIFHRGCRCGTSQAVLAAKFVKRSDRGGRGKEGGGYTVRARGAAVAKMKLDSYIGIPHNAPLSFKLILSRARPTMSA